MCCPAEYTHLEMLVLFCSLVFPMKNLYTGDRKWPVTVYCLYMQLLLKRGLVEPGDFLFRDMPQIHLLSLNEYVANALTCSLVMTGHVVKCMSVPICV